MQIMVDILVTKYGYESAFFRAANAGKTVIGRMLLDRKINAPRPDCQDGKALRDAATGGHTEFGRMLMDRARAPYDASYATRAGRLEIPDRNFQSL